MRFSLLAASLLAISPLTALAQDSKPAFPAAKEKKLYAKNDLRGKAAPKFEVESWLNKEPNRKGKVVLIDFWATWCPPCRELIPELEGLKTKFKDDLVVIGVSDEKTETVKKFMDDKKITYPMAIDATGKMKKAVGVEGIPHVLIIDSAGIVRWQGFPLSGEEKLTEDTIQKIIDADKAAHPRTSKDKPAEKVTESGVEKKPAPKPTGGG